MAETKSLKALAQKVLERNGERNAARNASLKIVSEAASARNARETISEAPETAADAQVIEATFAPVSTTFLYAGAEDIAPLEFPLCPDCQHRRYWLGTHGKVVCAVCGVVRFMIIALEFHPVN